MNKFEPTNASSSTVTKQKSANERSPIMSTPKCEKCSGRTYLSRREPHPKLGLMYELQTYRCASCEHCQEQDADLRITQ